MARIKILHPITSLDRDGAQQMLFRLVTHLPAAQYQHVIVSLRERMPFADEFESIGARVYCFDMAPAKPSIGALFRLRRMIKDEKPDLVQSWLYHANCYAALAMRGGLGHIPLVWGIRGSLDSGWERGFSTGLVIAASSYLSRFPSAITFNSSSSIEQHQRVGYRNQRMIFIPNGFDIIRFRFDAQVRNSVRERLSIAEDVALVGLAGRANQAKDYPGFIKAFKRVIEVNPKVHALIVGRGVDDLESPLRVLIEELQLKNDITLWGAQSDLAQCLPAFDIFCSSSVTEGFPNVVAEALACQIPCVVTNVGMGQELVANAGMVVPPSDPVALADGLLQLLRLPAAERQNLGVRGRERICSHYTLEAIIPQFESLYSSLCNR